MRTRTRNSGHSSNAEPLANLPVTAITGLSIPAQTYLLEFGDRVAHPLRVRIGVELKRRLERVAPVLLARATRSYAAHRAPHRDRSPNSATQRDIAPRSAT